MTTAAAAAVRQKEAFAAAVEALASAATKLSVLWETSGWPGDAYTPETGYPFDKDLAEVAANLWNWADGVWMDAEIAAGRA